MGIEPTSEAWESRTERPPPLSTSQIGKAQPTVNEEIPGNGRLWALDCSSGVRRCLKSKCWTNFSCRSQISTRVANSS